MITGIIHTALVVADYDEAKSFYCDKLGFVLVEDKPMGDKRWVRLRAPGEKGTEIILARADDEQQKASIGNQAGGRVLFFMHTDDFDSDYRRLKDFDVEFTEGPWDQPYGKVAIFKDLYGNRIDLIQPK